MAGERRKLLFCPLIAQRHRQEVISYPKVTATAVKTSRKLVGTEAGIHSLRVQLCKEQRAKVRSGSEIKPALEKA